MEFPFDIVSLIGAPPEWEGPYIGLVDEDTFQGYGCRALCDVFDSMGKASAVAQGLKKPVTSGTPHLSGQRIYLLAESNLALGFLKVGPKRLFVAPPAGANERATSGVGDALREINPVCALDFYVHESCQRGGFGRKIFDAMLEQEGLHPAKMAYDRPSPKLIGFLSKHFGLSRYRPQNNNYVVFDDYFQGQRRTPEDDRRRPPATGSGMGIFGGGGHLGDSTSMSRPPPLPHVAVTWGPGLGSATLGERRTPPPQQHQQLGGPFAHGEQRMPPPQQHQGPFAQSAQTPAGQRASTPSRQGDRHRSAAQSQSPIPAVGQDRDSYGVFAGSAVGRPSVGMHGVAGVPSRGHSRGGQSNRSSSLPTGGAGLSRSGSAVSHPEASAAGCYPRAGGGPGGSSSNRYASPLSHAGHRMMGQSPIC